MFIKLTDYHDGANRWVNMTTMESIVRAAGGSPTKLICVDGGSYSVDETPEEILALIEEAERKSDA